MAKLFYHENTKVGKHEIQVAFFLFSLSGILSKLCLENFCVKLRYPRFEFILRFLLVFDGLVAYKFQLGKLFETAFHVATTRLLWRGVHGERY